MERKGEFYWFFAVHLDVISEDMCKVGVSFTFNVRETLYDLAHVLFLKNANVLPELVSRSTSRSSVGTFIAEKLSPAVNRLKFALERIKRAREEEKEENLTDSFHSNMLPDLVIQLLLPLSRFLDPFHEQNLATQVGFRWRVGETVIGKGSYGKVSCLSTYFFCLRRSPFSGLPRRE